MKKLGDYLKYEQPTKYIVDSDEYSDEYDIPVLTAGKSFILGYTNETNNIFPKDKLPVIIFDDFTTDCKYVDFPFKVKSSAMKILHPIKNANAKFLYYFMTKIKFDNTLHKRYWISEYSQLPIKELNDNEQNEFVEKMQKLEVLINTRNKQIENCNKLIKSQFVEMFENKNYPRSVGKELFAFSSGKFLEENKRRESGIPVYGGNGIAWYTDCPLIDFNTIIFGRVGAYCGNVKKVNEPVWITDNAIYIKTFKKDVYNLNFLFNMMEYIDFSRFAQHSGQPKITQKPLEEYNYVVPPIEEQLKFSKIVEQIDKQKFEFESSLKKLEELQASLMQEYFG